MVDRSIYYPVHIRCFDTGGCGQSRADSLEAGIVVVGVGAGCRFGSTISRR